MREAVFRALADPTRCRIIELLARRDLTAGQIAEEFPMAFASVSHHLRTLRAAGLAATRRDGRHVHYRLEVAGFEAAMGFLLDTMARVGMRGSRVADLADR
ncbi:MAG: winged helix-turn-helix transcriptional regulator [Gemmatimonadota bacterium]|nr:MAG: winged helix-turn-helix transcriptional regulator [Gemmatimonadota bacterium]